MCRTVGVGMGSRRQRLWRWQSTAGTSAASRGGLRSFGRTLWGSSRWSRRAAAIPTIASATVGPGRAWLFKLASCFRLRVLLLQHQQGLSSCPAAKPQPVAIRHHKVGLVLVGRHPDTRQNNRRLLKLASCSALISPGATLPHRLKHLAVKGIVAVAP